MKIKKKKIRKVDNILGHFGENQEIYVAFIAETEAQNALVLRAGFMDLCDTNAKILPSEVGPVSQFNSQGKDVPLKNLPMETHYRCSLITDWHGDAHLVDIPYDRYPRKHIPAPEKEILIAEINGKCGVLSEPLLNRAEEYETICHVINLFLELFGECVILDSEKAPLLDESKVKRVRWRILPKGEVTWEVLQAHMPPEKRGGQRKKQQFCYSAIQNRNPDEIVVGIGGFSGYCVFVFKSLHMSIMENFSYGNATYVFGEDWQTVSKLTKAEIIEGKLQKARLTHHSNWKTDFDALFPEES